eukprot:2164718-Ditylum_brightwellii.AAC.1
MPPITEAKVPFIFFIKSDVVKNNLLSLLLGREVVMLDLLSEVSLASLDSKLLDRFVPLFEQPTEPELARLPNDAVICRTARWGRTNGNSRWWWCRGCHGYDVFFLLGKNEEEMLPIVMALIVLYGGKIQYQTDWGQDCNNKNESRKPINVLGYTKVFRP